jgi:hypothetical protein
MTKNPVECSCPWYIGKEFGAGETGECRLAAGQVSVTDSFDTTCTPEEQDDFVKRRAVFNIQNSDRLGLGEPLELEAGPERAETDPETIFSSTCPAVNVIWFDRARGGILPPQGVIAEFPLETAAA